MNSHFKKNCSLMTALFTIRISVSKMIAFGDYTAYHSDHNTRSTHPQGFLKIGGLNIQGGSSTSGFCNYLVFNSVKFSSTVDLLMESSRTFRADFFKARQGCWIFFYFWGIFTFKLQRRRMEK